MKKIILTAAAVFAFGFANAQEGIKFGVKAGLNFTNFSGDANSDGKTGFYVGGLADFTVSDKFHVQPELLYSNEGADDAKLDYIRIPIMAKYYVYQGLSIQAGPEFAFKIAAENDLLDDLTKSIDFALGIGAGYELPNGLFFDARYNLGLTNINDSNEDYDIKNTGFQIGAGYRF
ncbi:porin family protein [Flavobacterium microcysteis]